MGATLEVFDNERSCEVDTVEAGSEEMERLIDEEALNKDDTSLGAGKGVLDGDGVMLDTGVEVGPWTF